MAAFGNFKIDLLMRIDGNDPVSIGTAHVPLKDGEIDLRTILDAFIADLDALDALHQFIQPKYLLSHADRS